MKAQDQSPCMVESLRLACCHSKNDASQPAEYTLRAASTGLHCSQGLLYKASCAGPEAVATSNWLPDRFGTRSLAVEQQEDTVADHAESCLSFVM